MKLRAKNPIVLALLMAGSALSVLSIPSQAADPTTGRNLAATCAQCHGTDGKSIPGLAGDILVAARLKLFRDGKGAPTIMHQIAKGFSDEQIDLIGDYFSAQPRYYNPPPYNPSR